MRRALKKLDVHYSTIEEKFRLWELLVKTALQKKNLIKALEETVDKYT